MRTYLCVLMKAVVVGSIVLSAGLLYAEEPASSKIIDIGSRLELFVDRLLVNKLDGAEFRLHRPIKQPMAKSPLKGFHYATIIKDGDVYRAFLRDNDPDYAGKRNTGYPGEIYRYAESRDGHEWTFPKNNIIIKEPPFVHNFSPFLDRRPCIPAKKRYKAIAGVEVLLNTRLLKDPPGKPPFSGTLAEVHKQWGYPRDYAGGLYTFASFDGIHWKRTSDKAVINVSHEKAFDSQNVAFWSEAENCYICYFRTWIDPHTGRGGQSYGLCNILPLTFIIAGVCRLRSIVPNKRFHLTTLVVWNFYYK